MIDRMLVGAQRRVRRSGGPAQPGCYQILQFPSFYRFLLIFTDFTDFYWYGAQMGPNGAQMGPMGPKAPGKHRGAPGKHRGSPPIFGFFWNSFGSVLRFPLFFFFLGHFSMFSVFFFEFFDFSLFFDIIWYFFVIF